jgi:hypothetical protein
MDLFANIKLFLNLKPLQAIHKVIPTDKWSHLKNLSLNY